MISPAAHTCELSAPAVLAAYEAVTAAVPAPNAPVAEWERAYWVWNDIKLWLAGEASRRYFREAGNSNDLAAAEAFRLVREEIFPLQEAQDAVLRVIFLNCPRRKELESILGSQLFLRLELDQAAFAPVNIELNTQEGELVSQYERLFGNAEIRVDRESVTVSQANALLGDPDESVRQAAWEGLNTFVLAQAPQFHAWYDQLVSLRQQMAVNLGEKTFTSLGYRKMGRSDYGAAEVALFRASIRTHVRPLLLRVRQAQAKSLGSPTVKPWNITAFPGLSLPSNVVPVSNQIQQASRLFQQLHPKLSAHFETMVANGLIDLEARPGKRPGAFAIAFEDEAKIAIFCNSTGADSDVTTLTHEMGHAFQAWESLWIRPLETRLATMDAAELTSMGMEYLALKEIEAFFTPDEARRFARLKLINALQRLAYVAAVDEFQHWAYAHPGHSHAERERAWELAWDTYVPGIDFDNDDPAKRMRWMRQNHIFTVPFYYIDYALAEVGALQLWSIARKDHERALTSYLELCRIGGSVSLLDIFKSAQLHSPFELDVLGPIVAELAQELGL